MRLLSGLVLALGPTCARANGCYWTKVVVENGAKTVHKGFRDPYKRRGCRWNHDSGLRPPEAYALEVAILERLNEPRKASRCPGRYFPRLLRRHDNNLTFVQSYDGTNLLESPSTAQCFLTDQDLTRFAQCAEALLEASNVVHYDLKAKNTVIAGNKLTAIDFDLATLDGYPSTNDLSDRRYRTRKRTAYGPALREARAKRCVLERKSTVLWNRDNRRRRDLPTREGVARGPTHVSARLRQRREAVEAARARQRDFRRDQSQRLAAARRREKPDASDVRV